MQTLAISLISAMVLGGAIGLERSFHGHSAGLRTHTLVSIASCILMLATLSSGAHNSSSEAMRMAQGIMTGIGFLGAGVIIKGGLNVRGLTTAACIWIAAAIGILSGTGLYLFATVATILSLITLFFLRGIEPAIKTYTYAKLLIAYDLGVDHDEDEIKNIAEKHGFNTVCFNYERTKENTFMYFVTVKTREKNAFKSLAKALNSDNRIAFFRIDKTGEAVNQNARGTL